MRLREFSEFIPKPLVPVGRRPIVWNIMRYYAYYGHKDFILCLGYGGEQIKDFFLTDSEFRATDFQISAGKAKVLNNDPSLSDWKVTLVDTGYSSNIGERLVAVKHLLDGEEYFLANYSDGLSDVDTNQMISDLKSSKNVGTFVSVNPSNSLSRIIKNEKNLVTSIDYLSKTILINGGFFVFHHSIFDFIHEGEELVEEPFGRLIDEGRLMTHEHAGFWRAMDTFKDKKEFDDLFEQGNCPWEVWSD